MPEGFQSLTQVGSEGEREGGREGGMGVEVGRYGCQDEGLDEADTVVRRRGREGGRGGGREGRREGV